MPVLELRDIRRAFVEGYDVLQGVSLDVEPGEVVGLLGPNGAGKTTLLRIAMGMLHPAAGTVRVFGLDPWKDPVAIKRRVGYVSEDQVLPVQLTVAEVFAIHRGLFPTWSDDDARALLGELECPPNARIGHLSKGLARRVALVCALAHRPDLLLLDEPAGGLDPAARRDFLEAAIGNVSRDGCAVVFSSHHMPDVERIAGRVVLLHDGAVRIDRGLDACREGFTLAVAAPEAAGLLRTAEGFVSLRGRGEVVHALFQGRIDRVAGVDAEFTALTLEDLFIELVEGEA